MEIADVVSKVLFVVFSAVDGAIIHDLYCLYSGKYKK